MLRISESSACVTLFQESRWPILIMPSSLHENLVHLLHNFQACLSVALVVPLSLSSSKCFHTFCRSTSCWISVPERTVPVLRRSRRNSIPSTKNCAYTVVKSSSSLIIIPGHTLSSCCISGRVLLTLFILVFELLLVFMCFPLQESQLRRKRKIRTLRLKAAFLLWSTKSKARHRKPKRSQRRNRLPPVRNKQLPGFINTAIGLKS